MGSSHSLNNFDQFYTENLSHSYVRGGSSFGHRIGAFHFQATFSVHICKLNPINRCAACVCVCGGVRGGGGGGGGEGWISISITHILDRRSF